MLRILLRRLSRLQTNMPPPPTTAPPEAQYFGPDWPRHNQFITNPRNSFRFLNYLNSPTWLRRLALLVPPAQCEIQSDVVLPPRMHENGETIFIDTEMQIASKSKPLGFVVMFLGVFSVISGEAIIGMGFLAMIMAFGGFEPLLMQERRMVSRVQYLQHMNAFLIEKWRFGQRKLQIVPAQNLVQIANPKNHPRATAFFNFQVSSVNYDVFYKNSQTQQFYAFSSGGRWAKDPACLERLAVPQRKEYY